MTRFVPCLSLNDFKDPSKRAAFVDQLGQAYREFGFCSFTDHGLPSETVRAARQSFQWFFHQGLAQKMLCHDKNVGGRRGYTPMRVETAKDQTVADIKEFYHIGREFTVHDDQALLPNIWPPIRPDLMDEFEALLDADQNQSFGLDHQQELFDILLTDPGFRFRHYAVSLYEDFELVGREILRAMALALGGNEDDLWPMTVCGNSILRALHYPGLTPEQIAQMEPGAMRAAPHEDAGLITLLWGASSGGLEILSQGEWIPVSPQNQALVVNVGDMLSRLTNDVFPSTTHRVVNPPASKLSEPRYSLPFFMDPRPDVELATLPFCISDERPNRYPNPIRAHDFLMNRMREIKLQK